MKTSNTTLQRRGASFGLLTVTATVGEIVETSSRIRPVYTCGEICTFMVPSLREFQVFVGTKLFSIGGLVHPKAIGLLSNRRRCSPQLGQS